MDFVIHKAPGTPRGEGEEAIPRGWGTAGAAALELERRGILPAFACALDERLWKAGQGAVLPKRLALMHEQAMLLAPTPTEDGWRGFLVAEPEASGLVLPFTSVDGETFVLQLPALEAVEGVLSSLPVAELPIVG
mgnify:CR=1 FL=1